jgi:hypothetical protein
MRILINESQLGVIKEAFSVGLINIITEKFRHTNPDVDEDKIREYIKRFDEIKGSPNVKEKDITKYTWDQLVTVIVDNSNKKIKAGKVTDDISKQDLVYQREGLEIYKGETSEGCIRYGNGYNFCISSRGEDNMYKIYRNETNKGTPYFIFDKTLTNEPVEDRFDYTFKDPKHLIVLIAFYGENDGIETPDGYTFEDGPNNGASNIYYSLTAAGNKGTYYFSDYKSIVDRFPKLSQIKELFQPLDITPKETEMNNAESVLESDLVSLNRKDSTLSYFIRFTTLRDIENEDNKKILVYILKGGRTLHEVIPPAIKDGKISHYDYSKVLLTDEQDVQNYIDKRITNFKKQSLTIANQIIPDGVHRDKSAEFINAQVNSENYKIIPYNLEDGYKNFTQYVGNVVKTYKKYKESINDINFRYK